MTYTHIGMSLGKSISTSGSGDPLRLFFRHGYVIIISDVYLPIVISIPGFTLPVTKKPDLTEKKKVQFNHKNVDFL
jgi:hypothetical protein